MNNELRIIIIIGNGMAKTEMPAPQTDLRLITSDIEGIGIIKIEQKGVVIVRETLQIGQSFIGVHDGARQGFAAGFNQGDGRDLGMIHLILKQ